MRFFSGGRDTSKKKGAASQEYKAQLEAKRSGKGLAKEDPQEVYKKMMNERMQKLMEDILTGKKKNATVLPGTKQDDEKPKEMSKTTMMMLRMLAERKMQKDRKAMKKRERDYANQLKAKANEVKQQKAYEDLLAQQKSEYEAEQAAKAAAYWNNSGDSDKKDSWW